MKLIKDNIITEQKDEFIIDIYKSSGWEEVKEAPKVEPKKVDESDKKEIQLQNKKKKNK